jgi:prepilin-type N-terminal cleavage/methylation domain-containing protein
MKKTQDTRHNTQDAGRYELRSRSPRRSVAKPGNPRLPDGQGLTNRRGVTLTEMAVVMGIVALLVGLTIPAVNMLFNSFESETGAKSMISAALASARAIAAKEQRYAGIRFQKRYDPNSSILDTSQYMIFIIQDPAIMAFGFKAVDGIQPMKLPDSIGVMDLTIVQGRNIVNPVSPAAQIRIDDPVLGGNTAINDDFELIDATTFSIIFSPSGKLVVHGIRVRNRDGLTNNNSLDDIFNTDYNVETARIAMFYQDDYWTTLPYAFGPEPSRNSFIIYETKILKQTNQNFRWSNYLSRLKSIYVNPYTGTIIEQ